MNAVYDTLGPEGFGSYAVTWTPNGPTFTRVSKPPAALLVPGFVDVHIHGAYGYDFMESSHPELNTLCDRLAADGYDALLLTTVTASPEAVLAALAQLPNHPLVAGFHLEGPFISSHYPGAQPPEQIAQIPSAEDSLWAPVFNNPHLRLVTLAPELPGALQLILQLQQRGIIISMGHTNATFQEARQGFEFGVSHATHTFNAMRPLHHREPGTVGYALLNDAISTELIYDRLHVSPGAAELLFKSKPDDKVIAVSDSTKATGLPSGTEITMWGHPCTVDRGAVRLAGTETLAGSAVTLLDCFKNLATDFGPARAIRACSLNPRALLRLGAPRTWLEFDREFNLTARRRANGELITA